METSYVDPDPGYVPNFSWAGPYFGIHAGYGSAGFQGIFDIDEIAGGDPQDATYADGLEANSVLGGFHAGYNFQAGWAVFGIEADATLTDMEDEVTDDDEEDFIEANIDFLASLRGRLGVAADRWLIYGTGGLAYANGSFDLRDLAEGDSGSVDIDAIGGVVGGGVEWAMSQHVSVRVEGLYYLFDDDADTSDVVDDSDEGDTLGVDDIWVVRGGLNFNF